MISVLLAGTLMASLAGACPAAAQTIINAENGAGAADYRSPTFTASAGRLFSAVLVSTAYGAGTDEPEATITRAIVRWGDGTSSPASVTEPPLGSRGPVEIRGSHTYASGGTFRGAVDIDQHYNATDDHPAFDLRIIGQPGGVSGFTVNVGSGAAPPGSCPTPGTASVARSGSLNPALMTARVAQFPRTSQTPCVQAPATKKRFSKRTKKILQFVGDDFGVQAQLGQWVALPVAFVPGGAVAAGFIEGTAIPLGWVASYVQKLAADPPDPRFRSVARPRRTRFIRVRPGGRLTRTRARTVNRYLADLTRVAHLHTVLLTSVERAGGAELARNRRFERRQMLAAATYAGRAARVLRRLGKRSRAAVRALKAAGATYTVDTAMATQAQEVIRRSGLSSRAKRQFRLLGDGPDGEVQRRLVASILRSPPAKFTGRFPDALASRRTRRAFGREASVLGAFAKRTKRNPLAAVR